MPDTFQYDVFQSHNQADKPRPGAWPAGRLAGWPRLTARRRHFRWTGDGAGFSVVAVDRDRLVTNAVCFESDGIKCPRKPTASLSQPMKTTGFKTCLVVAAIAMLIPAWALAANRVTFDNQSGKPALVRLVGPTELQVTVENGRKESVPVAPGHYFIKIRYGTLGAYSYSKGDEFDVRETSTTKSEITITLHKVVSGNYGSREISETEFGGASAGLAGSPLGNNESGLTSTTTSAEKGAEQRTNAVKFETVGLRMREAILHKQASTYWKGDVLTICSNNLASAGLKVTVLLEGEIGYNLQKQMDAVFTINYEQSVGEQYANPGAGYFSGHRPIIHRAELRCVHKSGAFDVSAKCSGRSARSLSGTGMEIANQIISTAGNSFSDAVKASSIWGSINALKRDSGGRDVGNALTSPLPKETKN